VGGRGELWDTYAHMGRGTETLLNLMNLKGSSPSPVTHIWITTLVFFYTHFTRQKTHSMVLTIMSEVRIKQDKMLQNRYFSNLYYFMTFLEISLKIM
jgi:hypothetical protein